MGQENLLSVFDRVTQRIIADLEKGVRPWQKPWNGENAAPRVVRPIRHTGEPYQGVNILLLWGASLERGFINPTWMTFKQAEDYGAHVRKGEKASFVVYANKVKKVEVDKETGNEIEREIPFLRGYSVFNVEQIEGLPEKYSDIPPVMKLKPGIDRLAHVDEFLRNTGAIVRYGGDRAFYTPTADFIQVPVIEAFQDKESYYATLAHETTHWTRHETRLNRDFGRLKWGDEGYAKEELVAEIGAAFLCADLGITPEIREDHAAYIEHWLHALKDDKKLIFTAAAHATRAVEYLKSLQPAATPEAKPEQEAEKIKPIITAPAEQIPAPLEILHVSEPMTIGKHQWRLLIERQGQQTHTRYEFQDESGAFWHFSKEWRSYDINDTYLGLPKNLSKLYERERPALVRHGLLPPSPPSKQTSFNF